MRGAASAKGCSIDDCSCHCERRVWDQSFSIDGKVLDDPEARAVGVDSENETTIKAHVRQSVVGYTVDDIAYNGDVCSNLAFGSVELTNNLQVLSRRETHQRGKASQPAHRG